MAQKYPITLSASHRRKLESLTCSGESSARTQTRARILLLYDESQKKRETTKEIASALFCSLPTITATRKKYVEGGLEKAISDRPCSGAMPKVKGEVEA